jgi:hypothetical protein
MAIIYVNPTAASNGSGASLVDPKNTYVGLSMSAGDYVAQVAGTTFYADTEVTPSASATANAPITFCTADAQTGALVLDGTQRATIKANNGVGAAMTIGSRIHIHVRSLNLFGQDTVVSSTYGLNMRAAAESGASYNQVWNCVIRHPGGQGIGARGRYLKVMNTEISQCWTDGIFATVRDFEMGYCNIFDIDKGQTGIGDCIDIDGSIADLGITRIHHNTLVLDQPTNVKQCLLVKAVLGNLYCEDNHMYGAGGATIFSNVPNTYIVRNIITQPYTVAMAFGGGGSIHNVHSNVITSCNYVTQFNENDVVVIARNNTILNAKARVLSVGSAVTGTNITWQNNFVKRVGTGLSTDRLYTMGAGNTLTSENNAYFDPLPLITWEGINYSDLSSFTTASSQDATTIVGSDSKTNLQGYPLSGTPLSNSGVFFNSSRDATGTLRLNPPTIGAYEYITERVDAGIRGVR